MRIEDENNITLGFGRILVGTLIAGVCIITFMYASFTPTKTFETHIKSFDEHKVLQRQDMQNFDKKLDKILDLLISR